MYIENSNKHVLLYNNLHNRPFKVTPLDFQLKPYACLTSYSTSPHFYEGFWDMAVEILSIQEQKH